MSPKPKEQLAREHLERARGGVEGGDATEAVTWLLAALEAAIVAVAEAQGLETPTHHWKKAEVAGQLHVDGALAVDYSATLDTLNASRKVAVYEGEEPELGETSLEDLLELVEAAVIEAEGEAE